MFKEKFILIDMMWVMEFLLQ